MLKNRIANAILSGNKRPSYGASLVLRSLIVFPMRAHSCMMLIDMRKKLQFPGKAPPRIQQAAKMRVH